MPYDQKILAKRFQDMHREAGMFVLPNVWDAGSARVFEKRGFRAVATSSAGVAYSLGFPDVADDLYRGDVAALLDHSFTYAKANAFFRE